MNFDQRITDVYQKAVPAQWTYPQLFNALKTAGVSSYHTDVTSHRIEYFGEGTSIVHDGPAGFKADVGNFNQEGVIAAIRRAQRRETDYPTFLKELAAAGISHYKVDMAARTVSYFGKDSKNQYVEKVP